MKLKTMLGVCLAVLALFGSLLAPATAAEAAEGCAKGIGTGTAAIFVHGFNEKPSAGNSLMKEASKLDGVKVLEPFDYEKSNKSWVTDPQIGRRLAERITCIAVSSRAEGGSGKVIVIAHSMGGDAMRQAFSEITSLKSLVGLVITIGTPNLGSDFDRDATKALLKVCAAQILSPWALPNGINCAASTIALLKAIQAIPALATGSREMRALSWWPASVPVYGIAGNIRPTIPVFRIPSGITSKIGEPSGTDGIVRVKSALQGVKANGLGGTFEYVCVSPASLPMIGVKADCEHNLMLNSITVRNRVIDVLKKAIETYRPASPASPCPSAHEIGAAVKQFLSAQGVEVTRTDTGEVQCADGWAVTGILTTIEGGGQTDGAVVLHRQGATWKVVDLGSELKGGTACEQAPAQVKAWMGC